MEKLVRSLFGSFLKMFWYSKSSTLSFSLYFQIDVYICISYTTVYYMYVYIRIYIHIIFKLEQLPKIVTQQLVYIDVFFVTQHLSHCGICIPMNTFTISTGCLKLDVYIMRDYRWLPTFPR